MKFLSERQGFQNISFNKSISRFTWFHWHGPIFDLGYRLHSPAQLSILLVLPSSLLPPLLSLPKLILVPIIYYPPHIVPSPCPHYCHPWRVWSSITFTILLILYSDLSSSNSPDCKLLSTSSIIYCLPSPSLALNNGTITLLSHISSLLRQHNPLPEVDSMMIRKGNMMQPIWLALTS